MNYSELSDFEINKRVAVALGIETDCYFSEISQQVTLHVIGGVAQEKCVNLDYCNNPSDAWPIIVENGISIEKKSNKTDFWRAAMWEQISDNEFSSIHQAYFKNPLRAAMIVYLMMQEE